jgi:mRNA-degrading endonuclease RelE of RelBE toxin-antitoxin system
VARYALRFDERARKDLQELSPDVAERIVRRLAELEEAPEARGDTVKRLKGFAIPTSRLRVGDYRAIFRIAATFVVILRVVHRSELDRALRGLS